ncbi:MAG TPA: hypothetical protein VGX95_10685 [Xanthobacteraceae bacterium]|nr:hypothetical protein [Xanthobacteraceae bacterium]
MTVIASAGPLTAETVPNGDVWITDAPSPSPPRAAQNAPARWPLPVGDFWPADDGATRTADAPAPPKDAVAREASGTGVKESAFSG